MGQTLLLPLLDGGGGGPGLEHDCGLVVGGCSARTFGGRGSADGGDLVGQSLRIEGDLTVPGNVAVVNVGGVDGHLYLRVDAVCHVYPACHCNSHGGDCGGRVRNRGLASME